jgi:uncharacterized membrane protein
MSDTGYERYQPHRDWRYRDDWPPRRVSSEADRTLVLITYVLHLIGAVAGVTSIVAVILNHLKRNQCDPLLDSHHRWMIRSFWWGLFWLLVGVITWVILIGWVITGLVWLWFIYRQVRGLVRLADGLPMPA